MLTACTADEISSTQHTAADSRELTGIRATIEGNDAEAVTRAGTVTPLVDYVGRSEFVSGDAITFTEIRRTTTPLDNFTYPGKGYTKKVDGVDTHIDYDGIVFKAGEEGGWQRDETDNGPERIYWTDATNPHTFIAYSIPQSYGAYWKPYKFTEDTGESAVKKTYYVGAIGNPTVTGGVNDTIDFTLTAEQQADYTSTKNDVTIYRNPKLEHEDVVISHSTEMQAEPGGSVALVKFHHALASVRVVCNISGFSTGANATADNATVVSNMRLLHQPTIYLWMQADWKAQPMNSTTREGVTLSDQEIINAAWENAENRPAFNQRKALKLWIPRPEGSGSNQSKTFTFYGITTPQPSTYIGTLGSDDVNRNAELVFDVTYPNPMKPSTTVTKTYTATMKDCCFDAGFNTTINVTLNHQNEEMTVGVLYENWQFVATPDHSSLKKNSTFLQDTESTSVTIHTQTDKATADDATWLYQSGSDILDIYGNHGTATEPYRISTAYQLLSFAYEVNKGYDFSGKYISLDADLTLQPSTKKSKEETVKTSEEQDISSVASALAWIGIGDELHAFKGTFLGGNRFINRLKGKPLFVNLGANAKVEQLQVNAIAIGNREAEYTVVEGSGLLAESNAGKIFGCKIVGDVELNGTTAGALAGTNTGKIFACYHIGDTKGDTNTGGLVGTNSGTIASSYQAGTVSGTTKTGGITATNSGTLDNNYYNSDLLTPTEVIAGATGKSSSEMTKNAFVTEVNSAITTWLSNHSTEGYDAYHYVYQAANYPVIAKGATPTPEP